MDLDKLRDILKTDLRELAELLHNAGQSSMWDEAKYYLRDAAGLIQELTGKI
ncbi:MAG: hypothetical protein GF403_10335 [Candidatus Coatesbacteria bacterium]|nr:hypothetical protein [Candidatus Coatesbacteria bacterium]